MKQIIKLMPMLMFAAIAHYSCINDAEVNFLDDTHSDSDGNVALLIEIPNSAISRSAESSGVNEVGTKEEYAVKSLTVYLFDVTTETLKYEEELKNITQPEINGEKIQFTADKILVNPGTYHVFAIANGKAVAENITKLDEFLEAVDEVTYSTGKIATVPDGGFVMTNRASANQNVVVKEPTDSEKTTSISISLERVVAKIELSQTQDKFSLKDPGGTTYCTVKITNFKMLNLAKKFYTFRHTAVLNDFQKPASFDFGDIDENNGYLIDPYFFNKTIDGAEGFTNQDGFYAQALVDQVNDNSDWAGMGQSYIYCLENCMYRSAQLNAYSTGVMFKATIDIAADCVLDENGDVESDRPANMYYFNYRFYTSLDDIRKHALNNLPVDVTDASTTETLAKYSIKRFTKEENYTCYYNYWIKHLDNNSPEMGVMEFGIVRNNIYRLSVSKVAGLGSGEPHIDPDQPDEFKAELDINFDVFQWAIRNQIVELE